jgi:hypothetical protein
VSLRLRKIIHHPQATNAYRVVFTADDGREFQVGSIGLQTSARQRVYWHWGIDTVLPRQAFATSGEASDRDDAMNQFRAVWEVFASEPERLAKFLDGYRKPGPE